jgi:predicted transcriptional regulator
MNVPSGLPEPAVLGPFETSVMEVVWSVGGDARVRDVQARLAGSPAYTTVMTTMERLHRKGLLQRRRHGRAFVYQAAITRDGLASRRAGGFLARLLEGGAAPAPVLSSLVDAVSDRDRALLDELEQIIRKKKALRP